MIETPLLAKNTNNKLLVVEPDASVQATFSNFFKSLPDYTVNYRNLGAHAILYLQDSDVDVIVIDYALKDISVQDLILEIRKSSQAAILLLASGVGNEQKIDLMSAGVDVILDKPVSLSYLKAVIDRFQTRKRQLAALDKFIDQANADWHLMTDSWSLVSPQGVAVELSASEYKIFSVLVESIFKPVSREELAKHLGRDRCQNYAGYINTTICRLRKKVSDQLHCEICIRAYRSKGYILTTPVKVQ